MKRFHRTVVVVAVLAAGICLTARAQSPADPAPGYRGFSLPLPGHQLAFLKKGQRVDVLVTFEALMVGGNKEKVTATILQNVLILDLLKPDQPDGRGVLELMLNPNEAQYAALSVLQGEVRVTARAEGDAEMAAMEMASFKKLFK